MAETTDRLGIRPAHLHVVEPALAARVAAPAFDTLPVEERMARAADPLSFLNVLRAPEGVEHLARNRRALERLLADGVFTDGTGPRFAWYRLATDDHVQTGLVAEVAIQDYDEGRIVRHEHTRAEREEDLAAFQRRVAADGSPVAVAYRADRHMRAHARRATARPPHLQFTSDDGVEHTLWTAAGTDEVRAIRAAAARLPRLYVTDGHHRFAAASRMAAAGRAEGSGQDAADQWLLAALYPDDELRILPFHRAVARPRGPTTSDLLSALATHVHVTLLERPVPPDDPRMFTAFVDGDWFRLVVPSDTVDVDPLDALAVSVLQEHVLAPVFGVHEPRIDPRLTYVAGDADAVASHCRRHRAVGFMLRATTMHELMTIADADAVMPPKSTLFSPKPRAGIVLRLIA
ncbi:MAG TPA: DUF1015 family protein [Euzebyales bacterium]|nr:DUF1015 family protein [Euzebyales bacterium]